MLEQGSGAIMSVSLIASIRYFGIATPAFELSRAAVNALKRYLAGAYGPSGVWVNTLRLGMMETLMVPDGVTRGARERTHFNAEYQTRILSRRLDIGEECTDVEVFLASDHPTHENGVNLPDRRRLVRHDGLTEKR